METIIDTYITRIKRLCIQHDVEGVYPVFYSRVMFYLEELVDRVNEREPLNDDLVSHALIETHTIIAIDEDLEGLGMEKMMEVWESALSIEYGLDYTFETQ